MTEKHVFQYSQEQLFQVELELSACAHCHMSVQLQNGFRSTVCVWRTQSSVQHTQSYAYGKMEYCNKLRKLLRSTTHNCLWKHLLIFQVFILTHAFYNSKM